MSAFDNFKTAVKELAGKPKSESAENVAEIDDSQTTEQETPVFTVQPSQSAMKSQDYEIKNAYTQISESFITEDTVIEGNIKTKSNILIAGTVKSDVTSENNITVTGRIEGNTRGKDIRLMGCNIKGNIMSESLVMNQEAVVIGDVKGVTIDSDGRIKGNVNISGSASLKSNAVVFGDISAQTLSVQEGAIIQGNIYIIGKNADETNLF